MLTQCSKEKLPKILTSNGRRVKKLEKEEKAREAERRARDATVERFAPTLDNAATSPPPQQLTLPWYLDPQGDISSDKPESMGANFSGRFEDEPSQQLATVSGTQLLGKQGHETCSPSLASTHMDVVEPSQSNLVPIISRGRNGMETVFVGTGDDIGLRKKMAEGSLPAEPDNPNLETKETLHELYSRPEEIVTPPKIAKPHGLERRAVGAEATRGKKRSKGRYSSIETTLDDTTHGLRYFYASVPEHVNFVSKRSIEDSDDESVELSDQARGHGNGKASKANYKSNRGIDESKASGEEDREGSSSDDDSSTNKIMTPKEQLRKKDQRVKELEREKERHTGRLEGTISTMKALYEQQQQQLHQEQKAHAAAKKEYEKKVQELLALHSNEEAEIQRDLEEKYKKEVNNKKKKYEETLKAVEAEYRMHLENISAELNSAKESKVREIGELKARHASDMRQATEPLQKQIGFMKEELNSAKESKVREIGELKGKHAGDIRQATEPLQKQIGFMKEEFNSVKESKVREIGELKGKHAGDIRQATEPLQKQIGFMRDELERLKMEKASQAQTMKWEQEEALRREKENSQRVLTGMKSELARLKEVNATERRNLQDQHKIDMQLAGDSLRQQIQSLQTELRQLTLTKDKEIEANRVAHEAEIAKMKEDHEVDKVNEFRQLKEDNEALKSLLFKRDNFKAMTDNDLEDRFGAIRHEVDEVARVEWNRLYISSWPFPEQSLQQSKIKRVAKQHLIQNTLWVILYERIFCTPFRVLGSEGRALDGKWVREFGQGKCLGHYQLFID
jgi:hypothetical protein